jgi:hypothetical protein
MTRRNRNGGKGGKGGTGRRDQDLALVLGRLEAAFGEIEVLEVRPNPRPALPSQERKPPGQGRDAQEAQGILAFDVCRPGLAELGEGGELVGGGVVA